MIYDKRLNDMIKEMNYSGIQDIYTPIDTIEETTNFSFLNNINDVKEICILFNVEFFQYFIKQDYIKNNGIKLIFGYDCEIKKNIAIELSTDNKYSNIEAIDLTKFSETKDIKEFNKIMAGRKFDVVFSNPPYNDGLDLKILQALFTCSNKIIFIHPAGYILDNKFKKKLYNNIRNTNYLESINLFWGNIMFDIKLFMPLCISKWDMNKTNSICNVEDNAITHSNYSVNINDVSVHGKSFKDFIFNIQNYMKNHYNNINNNIANENKLTNYSVKFALLRGHAMEIDGWHEDFFSLICKDIHDNYCDSTFRMTESAKSHTSNGTAFPLWTFNSENERLNFINYCKTKFARFCLSFYKANANLYAGEMDLIPWLDFTRSWNDKDLCKEFNISKELWKYIDKFIPDYYDDYESGFEHHTCKTITSKVYDKPSQEMIDFCGEAIIEELNNKAYDKYWGQEFKKNPDVEPNGAIVVFEKNGKKCWIQKSINCKEGSKYYNRVGYELYEALDKNEQKI